MGIPLTRSSVDQVEPHSLSLIKGQRQVVSALEVYLRGYRNVAAASGSTACPFGPAALIGPPGTGKTLVGKVIHAELGNHRLVQTNGESLNKRVELTAILLHADEHTTIFIDEAQGMGSRTQHILLTAISERQLALPAGLSQHQQDLPLSAFTLILATTHEFLLQEALRNRMTVYCRFDYYSAEDLAEIVAQRAQALGWDYESPDILLKIGQRAKGTARQALNRNLQMCWQVARSHDRKVITQADLDEAFRHLQIDELGLEDIDRRYLKVLREADQAPLNVLSAKLGLPSRTIQNVVEPYLIREGFITKGRQSTRMLAQRGRSHLETTAWSG